MSQSQRKRNNPSSMQQSIFDFQKIDDGYFNLDLGVPYSQQPSQLENIELRDFTFMEDEKNCQYRTSEIDFGQFDVGEKEFIPVIPSELGSDWDIIDGPMHEVVEAKVVDTQFQPQSKGENEMNQKIVEAREVFPSRIPGNTRRINKLKVQIKKASETQTTKITKRKLMKDETSENVQEQLLKLNEELSQMPKKGKIIGKPKKSRKPKIPAAELKEIKRQRNETKNTIKNFGKQIILFVSENESKVARILSQIKSKLSYNQLKSELQKLKQKMSKIEHLRQLWVNEGYGREMRVISQEFLQKHCYQWIFNSRIEEYKSPIKYKYRLQKALLEPHKFFSLKV